MSELFDFEPVVTAIAQRDDLLTLAAPLSIDRIEDKCLLVEGDLDHDRWSRLLLRADNAIVVRGSITSSEDARNASEDACSQLESAGDTVVTGSACGFRIKAATVRVAGRIENCNLVATGDVVIGDELLESQVVTGDYQTHRQTLESLSRARERLLKEQNPLQRQLIRNEKRMDKACTVTPLDFAVGKIVSQVGDRMRIDLTSFYKSVTDRPNTDIERSLQEFFTKGIVGFIARANQTYLSNNPARKNIFVQLIKELRALFLLEHQVQMNTNQLSDIQQTMGQLLSKFNSQDTCVHLRGALGPNTELRFLRPSAVHDGDFQLQFEEGAASLATMAKETDDLTVVTTGASGESESRTVSSSELANITVRVQGGEVTWTPIR